MMSSTVIILISVTTVAILFGEAFAEQPTMCNPGTFNKIPPKLHEFLLTNPHFIVRLCEFLQDSDLINNKEFLKALQALPQYSPGVKRQDIDHVFLRFGKRR